ncbi:MAG: iron-containing alcohol dehydrogenase [Bacteroidales bacterium]|nr:iron-containing alcohol dehydrogenase [Candidatus Colimorpha onthohippi]
MNIDFSFQNPTRIHFGRTAMNHLAEELAQYGPRVLMVYGRNSIKSSGLYDNVMGALKTAGKDVVELSGIKSNPTYAQVLEGVELVRRQHTDLILAVGGGSVIDCSKAIGASAYFEGDIWNEFWSVNPSDIRHTVVPVGTILTMTGTASEMNSGSVITNEALKIKNGFHFPMSLCNPRFSILNPEFTYTLPHLQMASGIFDIFSHLMEQYFAGDDDCVSDYLLEGDMQALISAARAALRNPLDYEARSNIMWCATMGLNKILALSKRQDWMVHQIEHQLGAYTGCPHGAGLALISIPYYKLVYPYGLHRFVRFARNVWHIDPQGRNDEQMAEAGIEALAGFIAELRLPANLRELGATRDMLPLIAQSTNKIGGYMVPTTSQVLQILEACF